MQQPLNSIDANFLERCNMMEALVQTPAGVAFLQWLVRVSGFNKPSMSMEDAARRDVYLTIRPFIPVEKLSEIEHLDIRLQQQQTRQLLEQLPPPPEDLFDGPDNSIYASRI